MVGNSRVYALRAGVYARMCAPHGPYASDRACEIIGSGVDVCAHARADVILRPLMHVFVHGVPPALPETTTPRIRNGRRRKADFPQRATKTIAPQRSTFGSNVGFHKRAQTLYHPEAARRCT